MINGLKKAGLIVSDVSLGLLLILYFANLIAGLITKGGSSGSAIPAALIVFCIVTALCGIILLAVGRYFHLAASMTLIFWILNTIYLQFADVFYVGDVMTNTANTLMSMSSTFILVLLAFFFAIVLLTGKRNVLPPIAAMIFFSFELVISFVRFAADAEYYSTVGIISALLRLAAYIAVIVWCCFEFGRRRFTRSSSFPASSFSPPSRLIAAN